MCTEQQPKKLGQTLKQDKRTYYCIATPRLQLSWSQNLVIIYTRQSLQTTTQLLQGSSEAGAKIWSLYTQDKAYTTQLLQGSSEAGAKIWSLYTQDKAYTLQHNYCKAPVKLEPKFGPFIHNTKPTDYNTATARLQRSWNQNLVILYTRQSLHTTTQLLQGSSGAGAKIWSNYTTRLAYRLLQ